jgi:Sulfotransferase family
MGGSRRREKQREKDQRPNQAGQGTKVSLAVAGVGFSLTPRYVVFNSQISPLVEQFDHCVVFESSAGRGFIVGAPRSGTTLLMNLVAAHPEIAPVYETGFVRNLLRLCDREARASSGLWREKFFSQVRRQIDGRRTKKRAKRFVGKVLPSYQSTNRRKFGKTKDEFFPFGNRCIEYNFCELIHETAAFVGALATQNGGSGDSFTLGRRYLDRLFAIHCSRMNRPFWVNKTPSLVRCLDLLHRMYPECGMVHIVRDGRDVALSTTSVRSGPNNVLDAARRWKEMVRAGRRLAHNHRYLEVRYEELIAAPAKIMESVFTLLGFGASAAGSLPGLRIYGHREKVWREDMAPKDKRDFYKVAGDLLMELGYEKDDRWVR